MLKKIQTDNQVLRGQLKTDDETQLVEEPKKCCNGGSPVQTFEMAQYAVWNLLDEGWEGTSQHAAPAKSPATPLVLGHAPVSTPEAVAPEPSKPEDPVAPKRIISSQDSAKDCEQKVEDPSGAQNWANKYNGKDVRFRVKHGSDNWQPGTVIRIEDGNVRVMANADGECYLIKNEDNIEEIITTFWAKKQGGKWKTWKKRWFVIGDSTVTYYTSNTDVSDKTRKGTITLIKGDKIRAPRAGDKLQKGTADQTVVIDQEGGRTWYLTVLNLEVTRKEVMAALKAAVPTQRRRMLGRPLDRLMERINEQEQ